MEGLDNLIGRKLLSDKEISEESLIPRKPAIFFKSKLKNIIKPSCLKALQS